MNSYQSNTGPEAYVDQQFGGSSDQHFQDQNTMSHPFSSAPSTAYGYDVEDPGPLENTPQQEHRVSSADFRCEYCGREFSKQYELTLVSFQISQNIERNLLSIVSTNATTRSLWVAKSAMNERPSGKTWTDTTEPNIRHTLSHTIYRKSRKNVKTAGWRPGATIWNGTSEMQSMENIETGPKRSYCSSHLSFHSSFPWSFGDWGSR
jgi:hypothetical protein